MAGTHENLEHAEHAQHASHGGNKKIALLISVLALFLAFSETLGKSAQTEALTLNIKASDTWNFFQAKTVRQTAIRTAAEGLSAQASGIADEPTRAAVLKQVDAWKNTVTRYDSDPKEKDGRKELRAQAEHYEHERDNEEFEVHRPPPRPENSFSRFNSAGAIATSKKAGIRNSAVGKIILSGAM